MSRSHAPLAVVCLLGLSACTATKPAACPEVSHSPEMSAPSGTSGVSTPGATREDQTDPAESDPTGTPEESAEESAEARFAPAPLAAPPLFRRDQASPEQLDELNAWAQNEGLANNVAAFVTLGLPLAPDTRSTLELSFSPTESPNTATAVVTMEGLLDDSLAGQRFTLTFARKQCAEDCQADPQVWRVTAIESEVRCYPGRGHEAYSGEPCR